jgi:hypothetical protein
MAGGASENVLQQTVDSFASRVNDYAQGIAGRLGQPLSGVQLSPEDAVARWNFSPLGDTASADAQYFALTLQGMPPGQALAQVYPMRSGLFADPDINASIAKANQVAGWAAKASGQPPPEPFPSSTLPDHIHQQLVAQAATAPSSPPLPAPAQPPAPLLPGGAGGPGAAPMPGLPPPPAPPLS